MYYAYIIKSRKNHRFYVGSTQNVKKRIKQHEQGQTKILKSQGSFDIVHVEEFATRVEAFRRERQIKSYKGGNAFRKLLTQDLLGTSLSRLSLTSPAGSRQHLEIGRERPLACSFGSFKFSQNIK